MNNYHYLVRVSQTLTLSRSRYHTRLFSSSSTSSAVAVKKVTKSNFDSSLEDLRRNVRNADFVSVDLEMSGVTSAPWRESFEFDRLDVRYLKVKDSAEKFAVVQFGVCPFRWDGSKESFVAHPYNFYVFPRKELPVDEPAHEFLCQTTSMDFLSKHQFDFNAWIHEGISYLSRVQEGEALCSVDSAYSDELVNSGHHSKDPGEIPLVSTADIFFTERMKIGFREWREGLFRNSNEGNQFKGNSDGSKPQFQTIFFKMRPALLLNGFTSHQLKLIQLVIRKHFRDLTYVRVNGENSSEQKQVVYTDTEDDKALLMKEVKEELQKGMEAKVKAAVGFRHVIDLLVSEQKLIVGHNCFLDIAHIHSKFFGPLPPSIAEFASSVHKNFPYIIDTKHLLKTDNVIQYLMKKNSTSLSSAFTLLCPQIASPSSNFGLASRPYVKVEVQVDEMRSSSWNSGAKHEAGYDAFMTGCVFAQACNHLGISFKLDSPSTELVKNEKLHKHLNLLYPSWNSGTTINLMTGSEFPDSSLQNKNRRYPKIVFSNIILVWGFPLKLKPRELRECITKAFGPDSLTSIFYLDETAAFIQFSKKELVEEFLDLKDSLESNNDPISVLHPLAKLLEGGNTRVGNYDVYKQIVASSISQVLFKDQAEAAGIRWETKVEDGKESKLDNVGRSVTSRRKDVVSEPGHHFSCEQLLDPSYVTDILQGRWTRIV